MFTKNQTNPFFQTVRVAAEDAAKQMHATISNYVPTKPDSIPEQMSQVEDAVTKRPDAVVFTPVDFKAMGPGAAKAQRREDSGDQHHRPRQRRRSRDLHRLR